MQEWFQDKGVLKGIADGDIINTISAGIFAVMLVAITCRFLMEPPAGELKAAATAAGTVKSHPIAYQRAKSVAALMDPEKNDFETVMNFNDGRSPFGLKMNAEIWNGRIAMVRSDQYDVKSSVPHLVSFF